MRHLLPAVLVTAVVLSSGRISHAQVASAQATTTAAPATAERSIEDLNFLGGARQLNLEQAQLNVGFAWKWATWEPAGPNATAVSTLYFFKRWGNRRVEMKAGCNINDQEFVGLQVGGSSSTGAQGVYAVLPFEVGMSYYPLMAPSLNFRFKGPEGTYFKTAAQRSLDAAGGQSTIDRNPSGLEYQRGAAITPRVEDALTTTAY